MRYWKRCPKCGENKAIEEFYRDAGSRDGFQRTCKVCCHNATRASYIKHAAARRAHDVERYRNDPHRRAAVHRVSSEMRKKYPDRVRARRAVSNAISAGTLVRMPCSVCGSHESEGHHDDYSKLLEVRWLCRLHHEQLHHGASL